MPSDVVRCTPRTKMILMQRKRMSGHSCAELVEFAVINMPYIPIKNKKR